jgi:hypothetical protein
MGTLKIMFFPLAFCLACYGLWEFLLSYQYKDTQDKSKDWKVTEARLVERGDGIKPPGILGITPASFICLLVSKPYVDYKYEVASKKYHVRQQLPPCLTFVRLAISKDISDEVKPEVSDADIDLVDPGTGQLKSSFNELLEKQLELHMPIIQIKYNHADPEKSVTDPDKLKGTETLFWSGIWSIILAALSVAAAKFHEWVTKPTELPDPFASTSRTIRY